MNTDQSIFNANQQEVKDYLNNLAEAVCINGDALEKYEKVITKQYGEEVYNNMKLFVEEVQEYVKRKRFTNTSKVNLGYLGKNAGLSDGVIENIIMHYEHKFSNQRKHPKWLFPLIALIVVISGIFYLCDSYKLTDLETIINENVEFLENKEGSAFTFRNIQLDKTNKYVHFDIKANDNLNYSIRQSVDSLFSAVNERNAAIVLTASIIENEKPLISCAFKNILRQTIKSECGVIFFIDMDSLKAECEDIRYAIENGKNINHLDLDISIGM